LICEQVVQKHISEHTNRILVFRNDFHDFGTYLPNGIVLTVLEPIYQNLFFLKFKYFGTYEPKSTFIYAVAHLSLHNSHTLNFSRAILGRF
jgi:hypothetical protein